MKLKRAKDIQWQDLPRIEHPFFASRHIEDAFFDHHGGSRVRGIDEVLDDGYHYPPHGSDRDRHVLERLLKQTEQGEVFLVHEFDHKPFSQVVRWEIDDQGLGGLGSEPVQWPPVRQIAPGMDHPQAGTPAR